MNIYCDISYFVSIFCMVCELFLGLLGDLFCHFLSGMLTVPAMKISLSPLELESDGDW
jgi:hypothetical protein